MVEITNITPTLFECVIFFASGLIGAMASDILKDNHLELPKIEDGKIFLGCLGGFFIGGLAGLMIDGSPVTAFLGGFTGKEIILNLAKKMKPIKFN